MDPKVFTFGPRGLDKAAVEKTKLCVCGRNGTNEQMHEEETKVYGIPTREDAQR